MWLWAAWLWPFSPSRLRAWSMAPPRGNSVRLAGCPRVPVGMCTLRENVQREKESVSYVVVPITPASSQEAYRAHAPQPAGSGVDAVVLQPDGPPALALAGRWGPGWHPLAAPGRARP